MTMQTITHRYLQKFDELNDIAKNLLMVKQFPALQKFLELLEDAYIEGFAGAEYMLGVDITANYDAITRAMAKEYDGISIVSRFTEYYLTQDESSLERLIDSEVHRVYNTGAYDGAKASGKTVTKTWVTVMDDRVRETHSYLEGVSAPLDGYFYTFDGDKALMPGGFESASNNVNCRCILKYSAE